VFLQLEKAFESSDETAVATALKRLRRELNLGMRPRSRMTAAARPSRIPRKR
jgi:hypothetical protein